MKRLLSAVLALLLLLSLSVYAYANAYGSVDAAKNGVVRVVIYGDYKVYQLGRLVNSYQNVELGTGSAFAVGKKGEDVSYFVTNRHVVSEEVEYEQNDSYNYEISPKTFYIMLDNEMTLHPVDIIAVNATGPDLAIIKLKEATNQREPMLLHSYDDASKLNTATVYSVGFPGSLSAFLDESYSNASGVDMVSTRRGTFDHEIDAAHTGGEGTLILTDASMTGGNSGGPLVDEKGGVLGVCTMGSTYDTGMNAAISVNEVIKLLDAHRIPYQKTSNGFLDKELLIYIVLGAAIIGAVILLIILLRKPKSSKKPDLPKPPEATTQPAPRPVLATRTLIGVSGPLKDRRYVLEAGQSLYIGRDAGKCRVLFAEGTPGVSSIHCRISFNGKSAEITDLKSSYGTFVDRNKLPPNVPVALHRGLAIDIGSEMNRFTLQ